MRCLSALLLILGALFTTVVCAQQAAQGFSVLAYHDVRDDPLAAPDRYTVSTQNIAQHFAWLKENGYKVVALDDILKARAGGPPLPPKAVLLTFDDGYRSVYSRVFPLLKVFNYPAVVAVVGRWLEVEDGGTVTLDQREISRDEFVHWAELREMVLSGLVEVASHTHDLHRGVVGNPQGDAFPAAIARRYDPSESRYETEQQYEARVRDDLVRNSQLIATRLGKAPRAIVWPYGRHNPVVSRIARDAGLTVGFTLIPGANDAGTPVGTLRRDLVVYDPSIDELAATLAPARPAPMRVMHVDLDYVYDPDDAQQRANVGRLLDRVRAMGINTVFLQAYADPDGNGSAHALYFPNRHLPMRADIFSHVAWQLHTRANVNVYAWMPVTAYDGTPDAAMSDRVLSVRTEPTEGSIPRLSAFSPAVRTLVREIYEDLSQHAIFQGLLFHDDATLNDFEDASAPALDYYSREWGLPPDVQRIRSDRKLFSEWTRRKSRYLTDFTLELARIAGAYQQRLPIARNLYASVVLEPDSEEWFAQNFSDFLSAYDYTAVMAMPFMEGENEALPWLRRLITAVSRVPNALQRSVFELQSKDWRSGKPVPSSLIAEQMRALQLGGALNFGYYPDDFHTEQPELEIIKPVFSLESFPYKGVKAR